MAIKFSPSFQNFLDTMTWCRQQGSSGGEINPFSPVQERSYPGKDQVVIIQDLLQDLSAKATKISARETVVELRQSLADLSKDVDTFVNGLG